MILKKSFRLGKLTQSTLRNDYVCGYLGDSKSSFLCTFGSASFRADKKQNHIRGSYIKHLKQRCWLLCGRKSGARCGYQCGKGALRSFEGLNKEQKTVIRIAWTWSIRTEPNILILLIFHWVLVPLFPVLACVVAVSRLYHGNNNSVVVGWPTGRPVTLSTCSSGRSHVFFSLFQALAYVLAVSRLYHGGLAVVVQL